MNSGFFLAAGLNLYKAGAGNWSICAGVLACAAMIACSLLAEAYDSEVATGERVWEGGWGFQPDDALYLLPLFVWDPMRAQNPDWRCNQFPSRRSWRSLGFQCPYFAD